MRLSARRGAVALGLASLLLAGSVGENIPSAAAAPPPVPPVEETVPPAEEIPPSLEQTTPPAGTTAPAPEQSSPSASDPAADDADTSADDADPAPSSAPSAPSAPSAGAEATAAVGTTPTTSMKRDVVVYGGTPGGVAAAIAAADGGARVALVAERSTVGGLMSNGISASDIGSALAVQGLADEFFDRIRAWYRNPTTYRFEPRVAERVLVRMLREAGVVVLHRSRVTAVAVSDRRITCGRFGSYRICAGTFIDASYTGDLMARAQVPHRLGMGDFYAYDGETLPQRRGWAQVLAVPAEKAAAAAAAFDANPFVTVTDTLEPYAEAHRHGTPSITYRLCVTSRAGNKKPFKPAPGYAALVPSFRLLATRMRNEVVKKSNGTLLSDAFHLAAIPGGKYDLNAGRLSFTNLPTPPGYFDLGANRAAHDKLVRQYVESFFYFVQRDTSVPWSVRGTFSRFGLCADEFVANGNWPREPYVREGRRLHGRYTMTESDIFRNRVKSSSIALASYNLDSKLSQSVFAGRSLYRDLGVHATAPVYEIPYSAMLPRAGSIVNLLVPVGVSASPTAFGSIRMEPQWMALGEAAGVAAAIATDARKPVGSLSATSVRKGLRARGVLYRAVDVCRRTPTVFRAAGGYSPYCTVLPVTPRILK